MKLRSTILAVLAAAGLAAVSAGPASAHTPVGPLYDATFSGPAGVVWAGQCPALIAEDDNDWLPELCRPHGRAQAGFLLDKGITSVRYATDAGQTVFEATLSATSFNTTTYIQPGTSAENVILDPNRPFGQACPVVDGNVVIEQCVKSGIPVTQEELDLQRSIALAHTQANTAEKATTAKKHTKKSVKAKKVKKAAKHHR